MMYLICVTGGDCIFVCVCECECVCVCLFHSLPRQSSKQTHTDVNQMERVCHSPTPPHLTECSLDFLRQTALQRCHLLADISKPIRQHGCLIILPLIPTLLYPLKALLPSPAFITFPWPLKNKLMGCFWLMNHYSEGSDS